MAENNNVGKLIAAFVMLIIGVSLIGVVATSSRDVTALNHVINDTLDISTLRYGTGAINESKTVTLTYGYEGANAWKAEESTCYITPLVILNSSGATLTPTTDYTYTNAGVVTFLNTQAVNASMDNTTYTTYSYCPDTYLTTGFGRTAINVALGLFAIALLLGAVGVFYSVAKDTIL